MARRAPRYRGPKRIAPRLANGERRDHYTGGLPPDIKQGLQMRAVAEGKSLSWMLEQDLIRLYRMDKPEYVPPKKPTVEEKSEARGTIRRVK
jgi:hypothetical protein